MPYYNFFLGTDTYTILFGRSNPIYLPMLILLLNTPAYRPYFNVYTRKDVEWIIIFFCTGYIIYYYLIKCKYLTILHYKHNIQENPTI